MRNEIYAKYGYEFQTQEMKAYFENQPWYGEIRKIKLNEEEIYKYLFSDIERFNIKIIKDVEKVKRQETNQLYPTKM